MVNLGSARGRVMACVVALGVAACVAWPALARERAPFEARAGLDVASAAARIWAADAMLVYVENDEDLNPGGGAERWGYLFYSDQLQRARGYSVREGRIVTAENLEMAFEAPPVTTEWIDSGAAIRAAEESVGRAFRREHQAHLATMLLTRGALSDGDPDLTTWTLVYSSPQAPSLFVVVDAAAGKVRRTWRG